MATVFFSYSHKDELYRDQLEAHLALLKRQGLIESWHDRRILAGENFGDAIQAKLERADIILLLVSSDFLHSEYCYSNEMTRALELHSTSKAKVVPVILRDCDWHSAPFGTLMAVPQDGKAISLWGDRDQAWTVVAKELRRLVESLQVEAKGPSVPVARPSHQSTSTEGVVASTAPQVDTVRSSNLRLKKEFSDKDKAQFIRDTFDYVCRYFEGSVSAIGERNPDVEGRFERVDSRRMVAVLYRNGRNLATCSIRLEGMGRRDSNNIAYSTDPDTVANSYNELLTLEVGDYEMHVKPMGMSMMWSGADRDQHLSQEGAAEFLWELFVRQAQH